MVKRGELNNPSSMRNVRSMAWYAVKPWLWHEDLPPPFSVLGVYFLTYSCLCARRRGGGRVDDDGINGFSLHVRSVGRRAATCADRRMALCSLAVDDSCWRARTRRRRDGRTLMLTRINFAFHHLAGADDDMAPGRK